MSNWFSYGNGDRVSSVSADGGVVLRDEVHEAGVRLTMKRCKSCVSVSCSIYGWMHHIRFFDTVTDAQREFLLMKPPLANMVENILSAGKCDLKTWDAIAEFVRLFP